MEVILVAAHLSYTTPSYIDSDTIRRMKRYQHDGTPMIRSMYENRIGHLERSLSREKISKDRVTTTESISSLCTILTYIYYHIYKFVLYVENQFMLSSDRAPKAVTKRLA
uniref:Transposase n=1 Tax=Heterorhabditis bacteriophora TaxID=37862 RepID=A0A1I7X4G1_HETBA